MRTTRDTIVCHDGWLQIESQQPVQEDTTVKVSAFNDNNDPPEAAHVELSLFDIEQLVRVLEGALPRKVDTVPEPLPQVAKGESDE